MYTSYIHNTLDIHDTCIHDTYIHVYFGGAKKTMLKIAQSLYTNNPYNRKISF